MIKLGKASVGVGCPVIAGRYAIPDVKRGLMTGTRRSTILGVDSPSE